MRGIGPSYLSKTGRNTIGRLDVGEKLLPGRGLGLCGAAFGSTGGPLMKWRHAQLNPGMFSPARRKTGLPRPAQPYLSSVPLG